MEMTKKEYIGKLKKELDTIEIRYQHLLNENSMIGEDFRSRAYDNLCHAQTLEQRIEDCSEEMKNLKETIDDRDMQLVLKDRESEGFQMQSEEHLTHFDVMRIDRDRLQSLLDSAVSMSNNRAFEIEKINNEHLLKEKNRLEGKIDLGTQTTIGANYFNKKPPMGGDMGSSRGSGSLQSSSNRTRPGGGKQVGGGGRIANKPPAGGMRKDSRNADNTSQASKQGLAIDTTSQNSKQQQSVNNSQQEGVASPGVKRNAQAQQRSNGSQDRSQMNDDGMITPRNLPDRGQPGSGTLAENKRSMDGAMHN